MHILFILKNRTAHSGMTSGLLNSATFVADHLNSIFTDKRIASISHVNDANEIDRVVTQLDPDIVIIEALWITPAKLQEILSITRHRRRKWVIRVHSKTPFLANEGIAMPWIKDYCKIKYDNLFIAPNTEELTTQLKAVYKPWKIIYLPNLYKFRYNKPLRKKISSTTIDVGCFGALRPMKNTLQQAMAAIEFAESKKKHLRFHVNTSRLEQGGENVLKNLRGMFLATEHDLIEHTWYSHLDFLNLIAQMDIGMQISLSESFNIVTADFVSMGVPIVVSNDIDWIAGDLKVNPNSHTEAVKALERGYNSFVRPVIQKLSLKCYLNNAERVWDKFLFEFDTHA